MLSRAGYIWRHRAQHTLGDRAYVLYLVLLVGAIVIAPVGRVAWLWLSTPPVLAALHSTATPVLAGLATASLWIVALCVGRVRGPAILPHILAWIRATSPLSRWQGFGTAVLGAAALVICGVIVMVGMLAGVQLAAGLISPSTAIVMVSVAALAAVVAAALWLIAQCAPQPALIAAWVLGAAAALSVAVPAAWLPWGWVSAGFTGASWPIIPLALAAVAAWSGAVVLLNRSDTTALVHQSSAWESATTHIHALDVGAAVGGYQPAPAVGRRWRAVRSGTALAAIFLRRDAVGAARTPGRLAGAVVLFALASTALAFATAAATPAAGAACAAVMFAAAGPLSDGIRHAAHVARRPSLYGLPDWRLLGLHTLFPLAASSVIALVCAVPVAVFAADAACAVLAAAVLCACGSVAARIMIALKSALPLSLLASSGTPVDPFPAIRLVWALDGLIAALACGYGAITALSDPVPLIVTAVIMAVVTAVRWQTRRD